MNGVPLIPLLFFAVAGLMALVLGLRGRKIDDHPICRKCRFDLVGVWPGAEKCPECGAEIADARARRVGNRRRSGRLITVGAVLAAIGGVPLATLVLSVLIGPAANPYKPVWLLVTEARYSGPGVATAAMGELGSRITKKKLDRVTVSKLIAEGLARQADVQAPWLPGWGDFIMAAWNGGFAGNADLAAYIRGGVQFEAVVRERARVDEPTALKIVGRSSRLSKSADIWIAVNFDVIRLGDVEQHDAGTAYIRADTMNAGGFGTGFGSPTQTGPAAWSVSWTVRLMAGPPTGGMMAPSSIAEWKEERSGTITVVGADEPMIEVFRDDSLAEQLCGLIESPRVSIDSGRTFSVGSGEPGPEPPPTVTLLFTITEPFPIDAGFDVILAWQVAGQRVEARAGTLAIEAGTKGRIVRSCGALADGQVLPREMAAIGLILRPSFRAAESNGDIRRGWVGPDLLFSEAVVDDERERNTWRDRY
ncbi:MAG: hypothetical protein IT436_18085 [Phycisphaerales bacterium]|nr:hypothetical protein [Phycisphaerales bacterium]